MRRAPLVPAVLVFGCVGLILGLTDLRRLAAFPLDRLSALEKLPCPESVLWLKGLRGPVATLDALEAPLTGILVVLLFAAFLLLASLLSSRFYLLKPPDENPGAGVTSHLDVGQLLRVAAATALSLWLVGALSPIAAIVGSRTRGQGPAAVWALVLGGLPSWSEPLRGFSGWLLISAALTVSMWLLWGPGGPVAPDGRIQRREVLAWGLLAGAAALPAVVALYHGRRWLAQAATAYTLADQSGWAALAWACLLLPVLAAAYLPLHAYLFRPRPITSGRWPAVLGGSIALCAIGAAAATQAGGSLDALDLRRASLGERLRLQAASGRRVAVVLAPRGQAFYSTPENGSGQGWADSVACSDASVGQVEQFLEQRRYRTGLLFRAFVHLHDCASLEWESTRSLNVDLAMLERAPSPLAAELLLEKLTDCPITPSNRAVLDRLADSTRFVWPAGMRQRWLGAAYLRFGDAPRAREFLLDREAKLTNDQLRSLLSGTTPTPNGVVRGQVEVAGKRRGIRVGLVNADAWDEQSQVFKWMRLAGPCRPFEWRHISASASTDAEGRFTLRNVAEGRYLLVALDEAMRKPAGPLVINGHPDLIRVDAFRPERVLPPISIRFATPPDVPGDSDGNITAWIAGVRGGHG